MADSSYPLPPAAVAVPLLSAITLILNVPSHIWHFKNRNLAATCLVFWIILCNFFNLINAIIWPTDDIASWWHGKGLCDIEVKLMNAATLGLTGATISIMRSLAAALNTDRTVLLLSSAQRRRKLAIDCLYCFGGPIYMIAVHYIVQPNRYYIFTVSGCTPSFDNSWPSFALVYIWPMIFTLVDAYYCIIVIHRIRKYRKDFAAILDSSSSNLNKSRFMRLFSISVVIIVVELPLQAYNLYLNGTYPLIPYSWDAIHGPDWWHQIILVPSGNEVEFQTWARIALGFVVFFCFGLGNEAMKAYRSWLLKLGFGKLLPKLNRQPGGPAGGLQHINSSRNSFGSRARLYINRKLSFAGSTLSSLSRHGSISTVQSCSPNDPKKTFTPLSSLNEHQSITASETASQTNTYYSTDKALPNIPRSWPARSAEFWLQLKRLTRQPHGHNRD